MGRQCSVYFDNETWEFILKYKADNKISSVSQSLILLLQEAKVALQIKEIRYDTTKILKDG